MSNDAETYCRCMEEIKIRIGVVSSLLSGKIPIQREDVLAEFISVQLRKVLELIAFGSLTANKDAYAEVYTDFATHWNAKKLLSKLERIHPGFYPRPVIFCPSKDKRTHHFQYVQDGFLTRDEFVMLYRRCSEVLHARNPFRPPTTIRFEKTMQEWVTRIQQLLLVHVMRLSGSEHVWVVQMENPDDGKVHTTIAGPLDKATASDLSPNDGMTEEPRETTTPVRKGYRRSKMNSQRDPLTAFSEIREGIQTVLDNKNYGAVLILVYAGVDAMANLARPEGQVEVQPGDFMAWVNQYLKIEAEEKISGEEWYSARCAVLHTYGVESRRTRSGSARMLGYMVSGTPPVKYDRKVDQNLVIVNCVALAEAFFKGLDRFMVDLFADSDKRELNENRLSELFITTPVKKH